MSYTWSLLQHQQYNTRLGPCRWSANLSLSWKDLLKQWSQPLTTVLYCTVLSSLLYSMYFVKEFRKSLNSPDILWASFTHPSMHGKVCFKNICMCFECIRTSCRSRHNWEICGQTYSTHTHRSRRQSRLGSCQWHAWHDISLGVRSIASSSSPSFIPFLPSFPPLLFFPGPSLRLICNHPTPQLDFALLEYFILDNCMVYYIVRITESDINVTYCSVPLSIF